MDWNLVIEGNKEKLRRILASLVAMAGLAAVAPTLPRHLHRAVTKLLRPAESAARRLIVVAARGIVVPTPAPPRPRKPKRKPRPAVLRNGKGTGLILPPHLLAARFPTIHRPFSLPLFDSLRLPRPWRPITRSHPRISSLELWSTLRPVPPPPTPHDPVSAMRLALRFQALASVLDDLPRHALRLARLRALRKATAARDKATPPAHPRRWWYHRDRPLKPGHPPGWRKKPTHPVHEVLKDLHYFAFTALQKPDTS